MCEGQVQWIEMSEGWPPTFLKAGLENAVKGLMKSEVFLIEVLVERRFLESDSWETVKHWSGKTKR